MVLLIVLLSIAGYFAIGTVSGIVLMALELDKYNNASAACFWVQFFFWPIVWPFYWLAAYTTCEHKIVKRCIKKLNPQFSGNIN